VPADIETGLSLLSGLLSGPSSVWAALSTSGLKSLNLPPDAGKLVIATDGDDPGRSAGNALANRAKALGWQVCLLPAPDGRDWNDVLMSEKVAA
jgi:DNA primase